VFCLKTTGIHQLPDLVQIQKLTSYGNRGGSSSVAIILKCCVVRRIVLSLFDHKGETGSPSYGAYWRSGDLEIYGHWF
jgi:hypothetical protein